MLRHTQTDTLIFSPKGHLELHKLASVGWGLNTGKLVSRCISLKVWTRLWWFPRVSLFLQAYLLWPVFATVFLCYSLFFWPVLMFAHFPFIASASLFHSLCLHFSLHSLTPLPLLMNGVGTAPVASPKAAAVVFLDLFIQGVGKCSSAFKLALLFIMWMCPSAFTYHCGGWACLPGWRAGTRESAFIWEEWYCSVTKVAETIHFLQATLSVKTSTHFATDTSMHPSEKKTQNKNLSDMERKSESIKWSSMNDNEF